MCVAGVDAVMAMAASLDRDSLWGTGDVSYCSLRQEVRICPGEGEMVCIWDEVSVVGITVTIVHGISPPAPPPLVALGLEFTRPFASVVSVTVTVIP